ncbi:MAG: UpxY family transcription antiterminator [Bacteroidales bacterium]|nr:UpxY family transcription antiterminator [Bacteroidales bacterium]
MSEAEEKKWYVARTRARQEKKIKMRLDALSVENYLPLRPEEHFYSNGRHKKIDVPLLPNLIFIRIEPAARFALLSDFSNLFTHYVVDKFTGSSMVVPDRQMQDFIRVIATQDESIALEDMHLRKGDRVVVTGGVFKGIEGEFLTIKGRKKVLLRLEGLLAYSVEIPNQYLRKVGK